MLKSANNNGPTPVGQPVHEDGLYAVYDLSGGVEGPRMSALSADLALCPYEVFYRGSLLFVCATLDEALEAIDGDKADLEEALQRHDPDYVPGKRQDWFKVACDIVSPPTFPHVIKMADGRRLTVNHPSNPPELKTTGKPDLTAARAQLKAAVEAGVIPASATLSVTDASVRNAADSMGERASPLSPEALMRQALEHQKIARHLLSQAKAGKALLKARAAEKATGAALNRAAGYNPGWFR